MPNLVRSFVRDLEAVCIMLDTAEKLNNNGQTGKRLEVAQECFKNVIHKLRRVAATNEIECAEILGRIAEIKVTAPESAKASIDLVIQHFEGHSQ